MQMLQVPSWGFFTNPNRPLAHTMKAWLLGRQYTGWGNEIKEARWQASNEEEYSDQAEMVDADLDGLFGTMVDERNPSCAPKCGIWKNGPLVRGVLPLCMFLAIFWGVP